MSAEQRDVVKPVHVTKGEAVSAVASGVAIGTGIVAAAPLVAVGGGLIGIGMGLHVCNREAYEKARQGSESKEQREVVSK
jgi:F0F1-type ATP synthase assembly protein I